MGSALEVEGDERERFLDTACAGDTALRREVEGMLRSHAEAGSFLERPAVGERTREPAWAGRRLGCYRLIEEIGQGGMGSVYLAVREDGVHEAAVAVKVIRAGRQSREVVQRFENERRLLAGLRHPGIARLLDGGSTAEGLPYLVMEHVAGRPILDYCEEQLSSVAERLRLFCAVCDAVQHAHQSLVVHRDLKPANILVDAEGRPKLLDFGIAKLQTADASTTVTASERRPLTPGYASPEQIRGDAVTTASDVYSLGVLLFELLTGARPYAVEGLSPAEVERVVCSQEPARPSRVAGAARRIASDLDGIVLKALRKEPEARYATVRELSEDLARFLAGLPVRARPGGLAYRARKFIRRHRVGVAVAAAFVLLGLAAGINTRRQHLQAERERARAEQVSAFLVELFEVSDPDRERDPDLTKGESITARELLDRSEARIRRRLGSQPEVQAALMGTIGVVYSNLGLNQRATALLEEALERRRRLLGPRHAEVAQSLIDLAAAHGRSGDHDRAMALAREAMAMYRSLGQERSPGFATACFVAAAAPLHQGRYDVAEPLLREALAVGRRINPGPNAQTAEILDALALLLHYRGADAEAEALLRDTLASYRALGEMDHVEVAYVSRRLASVVAREGRISPEAEGLLREAAAIDRRLFGEASSYLAADLHNLAGLLLARGAVDEAEPLYLEAIAVCRKLEGQERAFLGNPLYGLGLVRHWKGDRQGAEQLYRESLETLRAGLPLAGAALSYPLLGLGSLLTERGELAEAETLLRQGLEMRRRAFRAGDWRIAQAENVWGAWLAAAGRYAEAGPLLTETTRRLQSALGDEHTATRRARKRLEDFARARAAAAAGAPGRH